MSAPFRLRAGVIDVTVSAPHRAALMAAISDRLDRGEGFALATLNLDHLVKLRADPAFRAAYAAHQMVTADGNPVVWLARLAGRPVELIPGSELVIPLAQLAVARGVPVALCGATPAVLEAAGQALVAAAPGLRIVAQIAPPMGLDPDGAAAGAILQQVAASGAALCFLALGAPRQERLAARGLTLAPGVGFVSVGAGLDFLAGTQRRAPPWVRAIAMEWLWRALSNPRRLLVRYVRCGLILPGLAWAAWAGRSG